MKIHMLTAACIFLTAMAAMGRASYPPIAEYEYAMLRAIDRDFSFYVDYSSTAEEYNIANTIDFDKNKETFSQARFKCFKYLNERGYELVSSSCYSFNKTSSAVEKENVNTSSKG